MRALLFCAFALAVSGCAGYEASSFSHRGQAFPGKRLTVGCLDVAVERVRDSQALGPVVGYTLANRCDAAVTVNLLAVRAVGIAPSGRRAPLALYDPDHEIRPAVLDARAVAREVIEYHARFGEETPDRLCLDLARLDRAAPAPERSQVCLGGAPEPRRASR